MKWALMVKGWACSFLAGQGVGLQGPRGSRGGTTGSQRPRGEPTGSQGVGQKGSRGGPTGSQGVKEGI